MSHGFGPGTVRGRYVFRGFEYLLYSYGFEGFTRLSIKPVISLKTDVTISNLKVVICKNIY